MHPQTILDDDEKKCFSCEEEAKKKKKERIYNVRISENKQMTKLHRRLCKKGLFVVKKKRFFYF